MSQIFKILFALLAIAISAQGQQTQRLVIRGNDTIDGWRWDGKDSIVYSLNQKTIFTDSGSSIIYQYYHGPNKNGKLFFSYNAKNTVTTKERSTHKRIDINGTPHYSEYRTDSSLIKIKYCTNGYDTCGYYWLGDNPRWAEADFIYTNQSKVRYNHYSPYYPAGSNFWLKSPDGKLIEGIKFRENFISYEELINPKKEKENLELRFSTIIPDDFNKREYNPSRVAVTWAELIGYDDDYPIIYYEDRRWRDPYDDSWHQNRTVQKLINERDTLLTEFYTYKALTYFNVVWEKRAVNHATGKENFEDEAIPFGLPNVNAIYRVKPNQLIAFTANTHWYQLPKSQKCHFEKQSIDTSLLDHLCIKIDDQAESFDEIFFDSLRVYLEPITPFVLNLENGFIKSIEVKGEYTVTQEWLGKREHPLLWLLNKELLVEVKELERVDSKWQEIYAKRINGFSDRLHIHTEIKDTYMVIEEFTNE